MIFRKNLEIEADYYEDTKKVLINNGLKVSEQKHGSRKILYGNFQVCGYSEIDYYLPISEKITGRKFNSFLGAFTKSLYNQLRKNNYLYDLEITFDGLSRDKNQKTWKKIKQKEIFYNVDLSSAYWQMAYKLNYISNKMFFNYIDKDEYKEAKRYCVSFLSRENRMIYYDNREITEVNCDISVLQQVYSNIRNELYNTIDKLKKSTSDWLDYNIDGISVKEKDLKLITEKLDSLNLKYKVNECIKIDSTSYYQKGKIRKF
jgi:hypothetical protein